MDAIRITNANYLSLELFAPRINEIAQKVKIDGLTYESQ